MTIAGRHYGTNELKLGMDTSYTAEKLIGLVRADPRRAARAVVPVLFPLDLLLLLCLGTFLTLCAVALAASAEVPPAWRWVLLVAPIAYAASDFTENVLLARMLLDVDAITDGLVDLTHRVTQLKLACFLLGTLQIFLLLILCAI
jgi:hypothetical protein